MPKKPQFLSAAFAAAIEAKREVLGLTQKEAAVQCGISQSSLSRFVRGDTPDVTSFICIVAWIGLSADMFIDRGTQS